MSNAYAAPNAAWMEKLLSLADRVSDADMARPAGGPGWTVGGLFCHLAFWDQRALILLQKWKASGITGSPMDIDVVNDAMLPFLKAVPPAEVRRLVQAAATSIDTAIAGLEPGFLSRVEADGKPVRLDRGAHREHHMAQIQKVLGV